uniref:Arf-GAP with coiled-coil, ANK repeat and PH domain-containing protein n=1 Tax=Ailuropoda melanoleuca TaxID=9646 RepID=A0A7N5JJC8_AILME
EPQARGGPVCSQLRCCYRATIEEVETDVVEIEAKLDKLVKLCSGMIEAGKAYVTTNRLFVSGVRDLSQQCQGDTVISECLQRFGDSLQEMVNYHMVSLPADVWGPVQGHFPLASHRRQPPPLVSLGKCVHLPPGAPPPQLDQLVIDSAVEKRDMERKHAAIQQRDFSYDEPKVEFDVDAPSGVVMEGYLFKRASNAFKTWNRRWFSIQNSQLVYQKKLKDVLTVVVEDLRLCSVKPCEDIERRFCFEVVSPTKSCMLQADSEKLRQAWVQAVQASIASAYRESPDSCYSERLDRTASPSTSSIDSATDSRERSVKGESVLQRVQNVAGNSQCGDCGQPDPRWASINLGVLLCIECSGIHRSLGVHCSKVRSLTLDSWEPELLKLMCELGNSTVNQIYEAQCEGQGSRKPTASSPRQDKEAWIKDKYVEKKFLRKPPSPSPRPPLTPLQARSWPLTIPLPVEGAESEESSGEADDGEAEAWGLADVRELHPGLLAHRAARTRDLPALATALAHGAEVNWADAEDEGKTPLVQAVLGGSLIVCEFLLQNGADVNQRDSRGRAPLHHATLLGRTGQVCLFLKRGADQHALDHEQQDPLSIAIQEANADIVTLLRLARMAEEMREAEAPPGQPGPLAGSSPTELQYRRCMQDQCIKDFGTFHPCI